MNAETTTAKTTIQDRPLMLSDLYLFIGIAKEAARDEGVAFEDMLADVVMDELAPETVQSAK